MDRSDWLREIRRATEANFDTLYAPTWDADDVPATDTHRRFVTMAIAASPPGGTILDIPCGTGKYFGLVEAAGRHVVGIDQSAGMLAQARAKHPAAALLRGGLQELASEQEYDGVLTIDSIENVPPDEWPLVLRNLRRAVRPGGLIYLTVEEVDREEVARAYAEASAEGLPVVLGEHTRRGGGYHHYPERRQVMQWLAVEGLDVVEEATTEASNYGYWHLLLIQRGGARIREDQPG